MKRQLILFLVGVLFFTFASAAQANIITNGSFETGNYTGWTLWETPGVNPDYGTWGIAPDGLVINPGDVTYDFFDSINVQQSSVGLPITYNATQGNYLAYQLQNGEQHHRMYQDIALGSDVSTLSWDMFYTNHYEEFVSGHQELAITIRDTSDMILADIFRTTEGIDPYSISMTSFSSDIAVFAGQTVRLSVDMYVEGYYFDAAFDNFAIDGTQPIPEPTTMLLLGTGLVGVAGAARRKKKNQA